MKMTMRLSLATLVLLLLAACGTVRPPPELETAAVREGYRFSNKSASAYSENTIGCKITSVSVSAYKTRQKELRGAKTESNAVDFYLSRYNQCTESGFYVSSSSSGKNFSIDKQLTKATLTATFEACRENFISGSSVCGPAELTLRWKGQGGLTRSRSVEQIKTPTYTEKSVFRGVSRDATASGTFSFKGKTYELSFPAPSDETFGTSLFSGRGSYVRITE